MIINVLPRFFKNHSV